MKDEQIHALANNHFTTGNNLTAYQIESYGRAIEAAATAPLLERIAALEAAKDEMMHLAARGADGLMSASQTIAALERKSDQDDETIQWQAAKLSQRVPDGWVMVPVEPTEAMYAAGDDAIAECKRNKCAPAGDVFRAMLAASPQPQPVQPITRMWHDRIKDAHPTSDPQYWPNALKVEYMEQEILDLRALVAQAKPEQAAQPLTRPQRRGLIDTAGNKTDGLGQDDFAQEIVLAVERHHGIAAPQPKDWP